MSFSELETENLRLKVEIEQLEFDVQKLNLTISRLKPRAELADKIIEFVPLVVMIFTIIIAINYSYCGYSSLLRRKISRKKEIFGT